MKKLISSLLALAMVLAIFGGVVVFNASAEDAEIHIPFINQFTVAQAQQMAVNTGKGPVTFSQDTDGKLIVNGVTAAAVSYGNYSYGFATSKGFNQWAKNALIDNVDVFKGGDFSNKKAFVIKLADPQSVTTTGKVSDISGMFFCLGSSLKRVCIDLKNPTISNGVFYYDLRNAQFQGAGWYQDCASFQETFFHTIDETQIQINAKTGELPIAFVVEDFYFINSADTEALGEAILAAEQMGIDTASAKDVYFKDEVTQAEVDKATKKLTDAMDEITFGYDKAKSDLNDLLDVSDSLGFFDSSYENYEDISYADTVYSNPDSTLEQLRTQVRIVRSCVIAETTDGELKAAFDRCINAWEYNYTSASYKALSTAIDQAFGLYEDDEAGAVAVLNAAYDALVIAPVRTVTGNFFDGWTTALVNDVVDANADRLCDSIGEGRNIENVYNNGDFSNNTIFEADNSISLTAAADFTDKAMGWKNMDRSQTLQAKKAGPYPPMTVTGISEADGIRFKIEATGSVKRMLIGLSNCSDIVREDYAMFIKPEFVTEDGYINIPFSYFERAFWTGQKFAKNELEQIIVFILECFGVEEDTTVTISDLRGYKALETATAEDAARVNDIAAKLAAFDIDGRYAELLAAADALDIDVNYTADYDEVYNQIFEVLKTYGDPDAAIVDVPGFSIYSQEELDQIIGYKNGVRLTKTERGVTHRLLQGSGDWMFANGVYVDGTGFNDEGVIDCCFGALTPIGDKNFIDMLGGYTLDKIYGYRLKVENAAAGSPMIIYYKDGVGIWNGMTTDDHIAYEGEDGYFTWIIDEAPVGKGQGGWYGNVTIEDIKTKTKFAGFSFYKNANKEIYGWQVILYESIDRSELKDALVSFKDLGLEGYADAMDVYYNKDATEQQIADAAAALVAEATPEAPSAPVLREVTYNSVTLEPGAKNIEFRCDDGEWTSLNVFEGLEPDTEYSFYARVMAIGAHPASEPSKALVVRTNKAPLNGEVVIEGEAVYGATLTAVATVTSENPGELSYVWSRANALEAIQVGTGAEYVVAKEDIGATLSVSVTAANLEGSIVSESTAEIAKATPVITKDPVPAVVLIGEKLGTAAISGAEVDVPGTWSWADPEIVPDIGQSGSTFAIVFTPEDTDCYNVVNAYIVVTITSNTTEQTVTDDASGLSVTGEFITGSVPEMTVADITPAKSSYLALLRAARNSEADNNLILFKNVSFSAQCYVGKLRLSAQLNSAKAGMEYTVWFFANGEVCSSNGIVDDYGVITVSDFVADVA